MKSRNQRSGWKQQDVSRCGFEEFDQLTVSFVKEAFTYLNFIWELNIKHQRSVKKNGSVSLHNEQNLF